MKLVDLLVFQGEKSGAEQCSCKKLFTTFFKIGAVTFGGGFAMIPLIQKEIVEKMCWMSQRECIDILGVTQIAPGAVAINSSIYIGYKLKGVKGALAAAAGMVLPSFLIITVIAMMFARMQEQPVVLAFFQGVRPGIVAMIAYAAYRMSSHILNKYFSWVIATAAFTAVVFFNIHPIAVIIGGGVAGYVSGIFSAEGSDN